MTRINQTLYSMVYGAAFFILYLLVSPSNAQVPTLFDQSQPFNQSQPSGSITLSSSQDQFVLEYDLSEVSDDSQLLEDAIQPILEEVNSSNIPLMQYIREQSHNFSQNSSLSDEDKLVFNRVHASLESMEGDLLDGRLDYDSGKLFLTITPKDGVSITAEEWQLVMAGVAGVASGWAFRLICVTSAVASGLAAPLPQTVTLGCIAVGGFVTGFITAFIAKAIDGELLEPKAWGQILGLAVITAAAAPAWELWVAKWANNPNGLSRAFQTIGRGAKRVWQFFGGSAQRGTDIEMNITEAGRGAVESINDYFEDNTPGIPDVIGPDEDLPLRDVSLPHYSGSEPIPQVDGELLKNTSFDDSFKPWWLNAGMSPQLKDGVVCVDVPTSKNLWDVIVGHNSIYLTSGIHTLRFRAKASKEFKGAVQVGPFDNPEKLAFMSKSMNLTTSWKNFEYDFKGLVDDPYTLSMLQFRLGASDEEFQFCLDSASIHGQEYEYKADKGSPIKVNQNGYAWSGPKRATLVNASGTTPLPWELKNSSGSVVASGSTEPRGRDFSAHTSVHIIDFSDYRPDSFFGQHTLSVEGVESAPFLIRNGLYKKLSRQAMTFFYTNRSGIRIDGGLAGSSKYERPAGHTESSYQGGDSAVPCHPVMPKITGGWTCDYKLDVTGGWYDAGDHGKYVVNGGIATSQLMSAWERAKANGATDLQGDSTLSIPEQGNGIPDVLDEAYWNLVFMLKMQVPEGKPLAGMAHHKIHDHEWSGLPTLPHEAKKKRQLHRPSTAATLNLAAVAAQGARVFKEYDAAFGVKLQSVAMRAYTAALANPSLFAPRADRIGGGPYADDDVSDEFYWAATQLYLMNGDTQYLDALRGSPYHSAGGGAFSQNGFYWGSVAALAQLDLARYANDLPEQNEVKKWVVDAAIRLVSFQRAEHFGQTYTPTEGKYDWGSNQSMLNNQVVIATAYDLTGNRNFADSVLEGLDYLLGRNALGQSYITGYGNDTRNQHHRWYAKSLDRKLPNPPDGTVSGGPNSSLQDPLAASWLHDCAPQLCFVDNIEAWSVNEITINWNSALAWVAAFAADITRLPE